MIVSKSGHRDSERKLFDSDPRKGVAELQFRDSIRAPVDSKIKTIDSDPGKRDSSTVGLALTSRGMQGGVRGAAPESHRGLAIDRGSE